MLFQVTNIEFDFDLDENEVPISEEYAQAVVEETIGQIWEADDEDDLVEEITCATGWCIKSIDYRLISQAYPNSSTKLRASIAEMTDIEWLQQLPEGVLEYVTGLVNDSNYPLDDVRDFVEEFGHVWLTEGAYETWAELTKSHSNYAIQVFVKEFGIECINDFEDNYMGTYYDVKDFAKAFYEMMGIEIPDGIVVDWEATWQANLRYDFTDLDGYIFRDF